MVFSYLISYLLLNKTKQPKKTFKINVIIFFSHQWLLVLHQADYLHRLLLKVIVQFLRQWRQHRVKVLLGHCVVSG